MRDKFRRLIGNADKPEPKSAPKPAPASRPPSPSAKIQPPAVPPPAPAPKAEPSGRQLAQEHLAKLQEKINKLTDDFAEGAINREQFKKLYEHYQRERRSIERLMAASDIKTGELKDAIADGKSILIRREHMARAEGYAIYENASGMPITTIGHFELDPELVIPMLSSFRAATQEIFGAGIRSTAIEGDRWLCFVPGEFTTMLAIFANEPAQKQLAALEDLHRLFERANRHRLTRSPIDPSGLLFPHEFYK